MCVYLECYICIADILHLSLLLSFVLFVGPLGQIQSCWRIDSCCPFRCPVKAELEIACERHPNNAGCSLPPPLTLDIVVACPPCQPYSENSNKRKSESPKKHKLFPTWYGDSGSVATMTAKLLPHRLFTENVGGAYMSFGKADPATAVGEFEAALRSIQRPDGQDHFEGVAVVGLNAKNFCSHNRYRTLAPTDSKQILTSRMVCAPG